MLKRWQAHGVMLIEKLVKVVEHIVYNMQFLFNILPKLLEHNCASSVNIWSLEIAGQQI